MLRGFINTIKLIRAEFVNEKKYGITTARIKKSDSSEFFHYQGASYLVLFKIFEHIANETKHFDFIDIGCGRGRPAFVAESFGYTTIIGIDLDASLVATANTNINYYVPKNKTSTFTFIHANALDFNYKNKPTVYFLFNPFNETVLNSVLNKILLTTSSNTFFIYMNPTCANVFTKDKFEVVYELKTKRYLEAIIYQLKQRV